MVLNVPNKHIKYCFFLFLLNFISAAPYLLFPSKIPGIPYFNDFYVYVFYANYSIKFLNQGILPIGAVWNSQLYCGYPATLLNGLTTVPGIVVLLFCYLTRDPVLSVKVTFFLFSLFSSYSMYYTMYTIEKHQRVSLISSIVFTFLNRRTYFAHLYISFTYCILPLLTLLWIKIMREAKITDFFLGSFLLSILILSHGYTAYFMIMFLLFLTAYFLVFETNRVKNITSAVTTLLLTLIITLPFLLPVLEIYGGVRATFTHWIFIRYSVRPVQLFFPILIIEKGELINYLGLSVLFLAATKIFFTIRQVRERSSNRQELLHNPKFILYLFGVALFFVIGSLGTYTPLYGLLFDYLPFFYNFRAPPRMLIITHLIFAIFSGLGAQELYKSIQKTKSFVFPLFTKEIFTYLISLIIFLDLSIYFGVAKDLASPSMITYSEMKDQEFIQFSLSKYSVRGFIFTPTTDIPSNTMKEFISQDPEECRILLINSDRESHFRAYTLDNKSFAGGHITHIRPRQYNIIQQETILELLKSEIPSYIGEKLALLGVKYVIYDSTVDLLRSTTFLPYINSMKKSNDLKFLLESEGLYLFENIRFEGMYLTFKHLPTDFTKLFKEQVDCDIKIQKMSEINIEVDIETNESLFIFLSQSFNPQWKISPLELRNKLSINQYYNMTSIFIRVPGEYKFSLIFQEYYNYLYVFGYFEIPTFLMLGVVWAILRRRQLTKLWLIS